MKQRMERMEDQLQAQNDQLASAEATVKAQQEVIETAALEDERGVKSALSTFLEQTEFSSWVAASYNYNFTGPDDLAVAAGGFNQGAVPGYWYPYYGNANTFQLDQVWFSMDKSPTEESRAGAHIDIVMGQASSAGGMTPVVYSAYVSWLAPLLGGIQFDFGKLPTWLGAEVEQTVDNFNVTRGLVWSMQPVTNTGLTAVWDIGESGFALKAGVLNNPISDPNWDDNAAKAVTSQVAYSADKFSVSAGYNWGREGNWGAPGGSDGNINDSTGLLDVLLTADPVETLSVWINYDYRMENNKLLAAPTINSKVNIQGIAVAGRLAVLKTTGIAMRFEYMNWKQEVLGFTTTSFDAIELTTTFDYAVTDNLTAKAEVRWDNTDPGNFLNPGGAAYSFFPPKENQVALLLQMYYQF
jgi:hypothetical protein